MLERRSIYFPIKVGQPSLARQVLAVAADLALGDLSAAERRTAALATTPAHNDVLSVAPSVDTSKPATTWTGKTGHHRVATETG